MPKKQREPYVGDVTYLVGYWQTVQPKKARAEVQEPEKPQPGERTCQESKHRAYGFHINRPGGRPPLCHICNWDTAFGGDHAHFSNYWTNGQREYFLRREIKRLWPDLYEASGGDLPGMEEAGAVS